MQRHKHPAQHHLQLKPVLQRLRLLEAVVVEVDAEEVVAVVEPVQQLPRPRAERQPKVAVDEEPQRSARRVVMAKLG